MDKYKKYPVPTKAKPIDQALYIVANLERENKQFKKVNVELLEVLKELLSCNLMVSPGTIERAEQAIVKAEGGLK